MTATTKGFAQGRMCADCPKPINNRSKSGRCRSCCTKAYHADPEWKARQHKALLATCADPASRARKSAAGKRVYADPAKRAAMSEAKRLAMTDPVKRGNVARAAAKTLRDWHATTDRDWSAWHKARHARAQQAKADKQAERERWERMTPFERQMAKVAAGARLITVQPLRRANPDITLGGVSEYL